MVVFKCVACHKETATTGLPVCKKCNIVFQSLTCCHEISEHYAILRRDKGILGSPAVKEHIKEYHKKVQDCIAIVHSNCEELTKRVPKKKRHHDGSSFVSPTAKVSRTPQPKAAARKSRLSVCLVCTKRGVTFGKSVCDRSSCEHKFDLLGKLGEAIHKAFVDARVEFKRDKDKVSFKDACLELQTETRDALDKVWCTKAKSRVLAREKRHAEVAQFESFISVALHEEKFNATKKEDDTMGVQQLLDPLETLEQALASLCLLD